MNISNKNNKHEQTSTLLKNSVNELTGDKVQIGILLYRLRRRSFGGLLFLLSALSLLPGISIIAGLVILVLAIQLLLGFRAPYLPRKISEYSLSVDHLKNILNKAISKIEFVEQFIKPRWNIFTIPPFTNLLGLFIVWLGILVMIPLPLTNLLPAIAILFIALGLIEKDGILVAIGTVIAVLATFIGGWIVYYALESVESILDRQ